MWRINTWYNLNNACVHFMCAWFDQRESPEYVCSCYCLLFILCRCFEERVGWNLVCFWCKWFEERENLKCVHFGFGFRYFGKWKRVHFVSMFWRTWGLKTGLFLVSMVWRTWEFKVRSFCVCASKNVRVHWWDSGIDVSVNENRFILCLCLEEREGWNLVYF